MLLGLIVLILVIILWAYGDRISMDYGVYLAKKEISDQNNMISNLSAQLKSLNDSVDMCKNSKSNPTSCVQESQLTLVSAGIGDNQSTLVHIRNDIALISKDLALVNTTLPRAQGYDDKMTAINKRLLSTRDRINSSAQLISQLVVKLPA